MVILRDFPHPDHVMTVITVFQACKQNFTVIFTIKSILFCVALILCTFGINPSNGVISEKRPCKIAHASSTLPCGTVYYAL